jgi:hypothetical protein
MFLNARCVSALHCIALRYAEQIMDKLSVFWQLKRGQVSHCQSPLFPKSAFMTRDFC